MDYELVVTLGPGSDHAAIWQGLIAAGASVFRVNTSHLSLSQLDSWLERLETFFRNQGQPLPIVLDLQGSKWRLGNFATFQLIEGQRVELVYADATEKVDVLPVPHADFFQAAGRSSGELVLNDARIRLVIESRAADHLGARVLAGGPIAAHKGITFTACDYRVETFSPKDQAILERTRGRSRLRFAVSYIKDGQEMRMYRARGGSEMYLIAKLERADAMAEVEAIGAVANELWLCRGDLGAELGLASMAAAAHRFAQKVPALPVPCLLAGQVLEHMTEHAQPTRSEVTCLYDALQSGYRGVVLSDEVAIGRDPLAACRMAAMFKF